MSLQVIARFLLLNLLFAAGFLPAQDEKAAASAAAEGRAVVYASGKLLTNEGFRVREQVSAVVFDQEGTGSLRLYLQAQNEYALLVALPDGSDRKWKARLLNAKGEAIETVGGQREDGSLQVLSVKVPRTGHYQLVVQLSDPEDGTATAKSPASCWVGYGYR